MWDWLFKVIFYGAGGLALATASVWYFGSLYSTLTGKGEVVIAPFEIVRSDGAVDKADGSALAHMLQVRLQEIEQTIDDAQTQLELEAPEGQVAPQDQSMPQGPFTIGPSLAPVLVQGVGLQTKLLEPADIKVSIAGVDVGQVLPWLQRRLVNRRTVVFTVYQKKKSVHVTGALTPMGLMNDSLTLDLDAEVPEESVPLDRVVERMAYAITRRRLADDPNNRVEALDDQEFQTLVEVLRETARLNLQVRRGRTLPLAFQALLQKSTILAESVDNWYQLDNLTASIAESAKDFKTAERFYERTATALPAETKFDAQRKSVEEKIADLQERMKSEDTQQTVQAHSPDAEKARLKMTEYADEAVTYFNNLLKQKLKPAIVKIQDDPTLKYSPYFDGNKSIVADKDVQYLPDLTFRNAAWPHLLALTGIQVNKQDDANDILYSAVDVLTMMMQQQHLKEDAVTSEWVLGKGYQNWINGEKLTEPYKGGPWVSFEKPTIAHIRDKSTNPIDRQYVNAGIFDRVFYLIATKSSTQRAGDIWISALRQMKKAGRPGYLKFGRLLHDNAGGDRDVVRDALLDVGIEI